MTRWIGAADMTRSSGAAGMTRLRGVLVLAGALALGACEDVTDPDSVRGTWELTAVDGDPLPAVMFDGETQFGHLVATALSGSLTLEEIDYTQRMAVDLVLDGTPLGDDQVVITGEYTVDGQLLSFEPDRTDYPDFTGTLQGGVLTTVEFDPEFGELSLRWER
ncbi:MAG TPA: hypothetical protein VMN78_08925 [Longimicrobiales bacterium]|nr:hypothetical protein [Longimicrobiales bacterium]